ncbi:MAG: helix-turn-helix transcriptional regulator [Acidobacteria bacterium]|nr:helix-turn-helix transcriptional regulator [Acidobacteriota bacterium]
MSEYITIALVSTMTGNQLSKYRKEKERTQLETAHALGVSQTYLSLLEAGKRPLTEKLVRKAIRFLNSPDENTDRSSAPEFKSDLGRSACGSPLAAWVTGASHLKRTGPRTRRFALAALNSPKRDARVVEALPWVVLTFPDMEWASLTKVAKAYDLQNRLGFITEVARSIASFRGDGLKGEKLLRCESRLERSLLVREETLCNETMTNAERRWLAVTRPEPAKRWHL